MNPDDTSHNGTITTRDRINEYLININADPNSSLRPTEAQLRWAHFQRAERVKETKAKIERLMHYPLNVSDVPHAFPSDGESTANDADEVDSLDECTSSAVVAQHEERAYLGMRRDNNGNWKRRHFSQKRFPHLAKNVPSSPGRNLYATQSCESEHSTPIRKSTRRKKKADISRGRRALLRVSARNLEERKRQLSASVGQMAIRRSSPVSFSHDLPTLSENHSKEESETTPTKGKSKRKKKKKHKVVFENASDLDSFRMLPTERKISTLTLEDEISALFTARTGESSRKLSANGKLLRRRRGDSSLSTYISNEEEERIRRFEEAYRAIMLASDATLYENDEATVSSEWINSGGKRWSRDPNISSAVSIDGRMYDDLQRTPTMSKRQMKTSPDCWKNGIFCEPLQDRGATWMVHVPRPIKENAKLDTIDQKVDAQCSPSRGRGRERQRQNRNLLLSPCQRKLVDIEQTIQRSVSRPKFDLVQNRRAVAQSPMRQNVPMDSSGRGRRQCSSSLSVEAKGAIVNGQQILPAMRRVVGLPKFSNEIDNTNTRPTPNTFSTSATQPTVGLPNNVITPTDGRSASHKHNQSQTRVAEKFEPNIISKELAKNDTICIKAATPQSNVRTSTLRLLFSGISETPTPPKRSNVQPKRLHQSKTEFLKSTPYKTELSAKADSLTSSQHDRSTVGIQYKFEHCKISVDSTRTSPDPIFGRGSGFNKGVLSDERMDWTFSSPYCDASTDGTREDQAGTAEYAVKPEDYFDMQRLDPPDDNLYNSSLRSQTVEPSYDGNDERQNCSSMSLTFQHLDVADLVRKSLAQRSDRSIIDTDGAATDITGDFDEEQYMAKMGSLLMSPALITKRYLQALQAVELRNWEQVFYLINADPWLMEMKDLRNDQYLVHALALFGAGQHDEDDAQPAPIELIKEMIEHDPSVAHKLDNEGNLPLHMAAASGNIAMIKELGLRFAGAASVQNHDGLLPLHLAIMSCALFPTGEEAVELILLLFCGAVSVRDNDGNTPLHIAAGTLKGDVGVDVIYQIMAVCHDLAHNDPVHLKERMGCNIKKPLVSCSKQFDDTATVITTTTDPFSDASGREDSCPGSVFCLLKNNNGDTPLTRAIKSLAGWQVVEALITNGGHLAVLEKNSASQNALHLVLEPELTDASVVLAILKAVPSAAPIADGSGILPIQLACMNCVQREIILAIAIIDLPIDLGARQEAIMRNGFGASWWFLVCESDDRYVDIVAEILSMCSHPQKTALCLTRANPNGTNKSVVTCATPQCKSALMGSLRFLGRFEFTGDEKMTEATSEYAQQFSAIDYGRSEDPKGRRVSLQCYMNDIEYLKETHHLHQALFNGHWLERLEFFSVTELESSTPHDIRIKHCVAISVPSMSLARVVAGMPRNHKYRRDANSLGRYFGKVKSVLLQTAKALSHLHENDIVHGLIDSHHVGKFDDAWKVTGLLGSTLTGSKLPSSRLGLHLPPEAFADDTPISVPSFDVWSFGKLMYEVFVGEILFAPFEGDRDEYVTILSWNEGHVAIIADELFAAGIGEVGLDLILSCLCAREKGRYDSMAHVLQHPFWHDANAFNIH